jgi:hypothetical protein
MVRHMPPRVSSRVAVDPAWSKSCTCSLGKNWRDLEDAPRHCPACGGILKVKKIATD